MILHLLNFHQSIEHTDDQVEELLICERLSLPLLNDRLNTEIDIVENDLIHIFLKAYGGGCSEGNDFADVDKVVEGGSLHELKFLKFGLIDLWMEEEGFGGEGSVSENFAELGDLPADGV